MQRGGYWTELIGTGTLGNLEKCKSWINLLMPAQMPSVVSEYERWLKTVDLS